MTFINRFILLIAFISEPFLTDAQRDWQAFGIPDFYAEYLNQTTKLYKELFQNRDYERYLSPVYENMPKNWTTSKWPRFTLVFILGYTKLLAVDAQSQTWSIGMALWMQWQDVRLSWSPSDYGGLEYIWVNPQNIWIPEHDIGNARTLDRIYDQDEQTTKLWHNGSVTQIRQYYAELECPIDVATFPFDRQFCQIPIKAAAYDQNQVNMVSSVNTDFPPSASSNGEWNVKNITILMEQLGGRNMVFDQLSFVFELHRVPNFYIYVIALPCFILTLLSIVGMFWSPNEEETQIPKLSIGLTSLVSMTVLLQMVSEAIPKTTKFPLLGIYVVVDLILIAIACVIVVAFTLKHPKNRLRKATEMEGRESLSIFAKVFDSVLAPHILLHVLFQSLNIANFVVLMSFWRND